MMMLYEKCKIVPMMAIDSKTVFITGEDYKITDEGYKALDLVLNNPLPLSTKDFNLGEIISKYKDMVKFSKELKYNVYSIDKSSISARLEQLRKQREVLNKERSKAWDRYVRHGDMVSAEKSQLLERELGEITSCIINAEELLGRAIEGKIYVKEDIMGEFILSPYPHVVLYYKNIQEASSDPVSGLVSVFVHEMFHAWNYFESGSQNRSVMEIDEAMVEFATLHYLNTLADSLKQSDVKLAVLMEQCAMWQKRSIRKKKDAVGSTAAYGFGLCLGENVSADAPLWIETYAGKSASLNPDDDPKVKEVMNALAPFYPFDKEDKVFKLFKGVIFAKEKTRSAGGTRISQTDVLKSCLDTMAKDEFTLEDVYVFEPIFKTLYPGNMHLRDKLRQLLQKLVAQGDVIRVSSGCYKKS